MTSSPKDFKLNTPSGYNLITKIRNTLKKIFQLQHEKKNIDRIIDATKNEIRKYLKRERAKKLPEDATFMDFACRFGKNSDDAQNMSASQISTALDSAKEAAWIQCYVEIIATPSYKKKTTPIESEEEV